MKQASISLQEPHSGFSEYYAPYFYQDEATKEKIQRHLTDINDVITDDDMRNIDTSITFKSEPVAPDILLRAITL